LEDITPLFYPWIKLREVVKYLIRKTIYWRNLYKLLIVDIDKCGILKRFFVLWPSFMFYGQCYFYVLSMGLEVLFSWTKHWSSMINIDLFWFYLSMIHTLLCSLIGCLVDMICLPASSCLHLIKCPCVLASLIFHE
jgi:hypothetical protein